MKILCTFFVYFLSYVAMAQPQIAFPHVPQMTPNAASIAMYQDIPVSYYTGTPQINIPLYEIDVDGFKLPITLRYNATGIRVSQEASWVGLGWSLDVGGRISRCVKNVDDFLNGKNDPGHPYMELGYYYAPDFEYVSEYEGFLHPNTYGLFSYSLHPLPESVFAEHHTEQIYDSEPDIFYYNLPSLGGKFIFDKSQHAVLFDKNHNLSVNFNRNSSTNELCFTLKDGTGNKYIFKNTETTQTYRQKKKLNKNGTELSCRYDMSETEFLEWSDSGWDFQLDELIMDPNRQNPYELVSSWLLTEIVTNKNRHIYFYYDVEDQYMPTQESSEIYNLSRYWTNIQESSPHKEYYVSKNVNRALRLRKIEWDFGYVNFTCSERRDIKTSRSDRSKKLDRISIYNKSANLIKAIDFDYDYFNSDYEDTEYEHVFLRLKLNKVTDSSIDRPYEFSYNETHSLPAKNSKNTDYWGYYNGRDYGENYCVGIFCNGTKYSGVKKDANFEYAITYTLNGIKYPTGGNEYYDFESHIIQTFFYYRTNDDFGNIRDLPETTPSYSSREILYVDTYNNAGINDWAYENYPSDTTIRFNIYGKTAVAISCVLDNVSGLKDETFAYADYLGTLRKQTTPRWTKYVYDTYPLVYESNTNNGGVGSEVALNAKVFILDEGTYEFSTGNLPKEVHAEWKLVLDKQYTPGSHEEENESVPRFEYGGGIRIKAIRSDKGTRSFTYHGGKLLTEPVLSYIGNRNLHGEENSYIIQVSESTTPMSTFNHGYSVGYDCVTETYEDDDCPSYTKYYYLNDSECELVDDNFAEGPVNIIYTNGLLSKKEIYWDDNLMKENDYEYTITRSDRIKAIYDRSLKYSVGEWTDYYYTVEWPLVSRETETITDLHGNERTKTKLHTYNTNDLITMTSESVGDVTYTNFVYYPTDFREDTNICEEMSDSNVVSLPIETVLLKNNDVINANRAIYYKENDMFMIQDHEELESETPEQLSNYREKYLIKESFDSYDTFGNVRQYRDQYGKIYTYLWGYNNHYLVAKIENATYNEVCNILGGDEYIQRFLSRDYPTDEETRCFLHPLYGPNVTNKLATIYTYKPLVGMTSQTSPNGMTTYYEYDFAGRLREEYIIKDGVRQVLKRHRYNYADSEN